MVSFFTRRPIAIAAIITGVISPLMMRRISASISSWKISRCSMTRVSASVLVMAWTSVLEDAAHGRRSRARCRRGHVQVGDEAQAGTGPVAQHALRAQAATSSAGPRPPASHEDDVGLRPPARHARHAAQALGQARAHARGRRPGGRRGGRAHAAPPPPARRPGACRRRASCARGARAAISACRADQRRAHRRAQALAEADRHAVEVAAPWPSHWPAHRRRARPRR